MSAHASLRAFCLSREARGRPSSLAPPPTAVKLRLPLSVRLLNKPLRLFRSHAVPGAHPFHALGCRPLQRKVADGSDADSGEPELQSYVVVFENQFIHALSIVGHSTDSEPRLPQTGSFRSGRPRFASERLPHAGGVCQSAPLIAVRLALPSSAASATNPISSV